MWTDIATLILVFLHCLHHCCSSNSNMDNDHDNVDRRGRGRPRTFRVCKAAPFNNCQKRRQWAFNGYCARCYKLNVEGELMDLPERRNNNDIADQRGWCHLRTFRLCRAATLNSFCIETKDSIYTKVLLLSLRPTTAVFRYEDIEYISSSFLHREDIQCGSWGLKRR